MFRRNVDVNTEYLKNIGKIFVCPFQTLWQICTNNFVFYSKSCMAVDSTVWSCGSLDLGGTQIWQSLNIRPDLWVLSSLGNICDSQFVTVCKWAVYFVKSFLMALQMDTLRLFSRISGILIRKILLYPRQYLSILHSLDIAVRKFNIGFYYRPFWS